MSSYVSVALVQEGLAVQPWMPQNAHLAGEQFSPGSLEELLGEHRAHLIVLVPAFTEVTKPILTEVGEGPLSPCN